MLGGFVAYTGAADHYLGVLAAALGRPWEAADHLRAAVELHQRAGATAWAALSGEHLRRLEEPAAQAANVFRSQGGVWTLTFDGVTAHLPDSKGLRDLATLLGAPGEPVHAVRLLGGHPPAVGADPVLDDRARAGYRARLAELDAELDQAGADNDPHRADRAQLEREALLAELSRAVGLGAAPAAWATTPSGPARRSAPASTTPSPASSASTPPSAATCARPSPPAPTAATPLPNPSTGACDVGWSVAVDEAGEAAAAATW